MSELFTYPEKQVTEFKQRFVEIILENNFPHFFDDFEDAVLDNKERIPKEEIDLLYSNINIKAVFAIRSDRMSELNALADKITDIQKVFYELKQFSINQAHDAILQPAQYEGSYESMKFSYTDKTINKILNFLTNDFKQKEVETTQLQLICQKLEEKIIYQSRTGILETEKVIHENELPKFNDLFLLFYKDAIEQLNTDEREKAKRFIEFELIKKQRRITVDSHTCEQYISKDSLSKLENIHLIRREQTSDNRYSYELSHDTLVEPISVEAEKRKQIEENQRLKAKQRRQIRIIALAVLVSAVSFGAAIFGFWQKEKATNAFNDLQEEQRLREVEKQKNDSLNFQFYLNEGINQKENGEYSEAIQSLNFALKFDSTKQVTELITECESKIGIEKRFNDLLSAGQNFEQRGKNFYVEAMQKYRQAKALDYNNQLIENEILRLNGKIDAFVQEAKSKAGYLIGTDNENAKKLWIQPALRMKPNDEELKKLLYKANQ